MSSHKYWFRPLAPFGKQYLIEDPVVARIICVTPRLSFLLAVVITASFQSVLASLCLLLLVLMNVACFKWMTKDLPKRSASIDWDFFRLGPRLVLAALLVVLCLLAYR